MEEFKEGEYDKINRQIEFDILKYQLANHALEQFKNTHTLFKCIKPDYKQCLILSLAKYQCLKIINLRNTLFEMKNIYGVDKKLWTDYMKSIQFEVVTSNLIQKSQLGSWVMKNIYEDQLANKKKYYTNFNFFKNYVEAIFTNN